MDAIEVKTKWSHKNRVKYALGYLILRFAWGSLLWGCVQKLALCYQAFKITCIDVVP